MTLATIKRHIEGFRKRQKNEWERSEYQAWLTGHYTMYAIGVHISKKIKYPKNPMEQEVIVIEDMEITDEEREYYTQKWFEKLQRMANKHNNKKNYQKQKE